MKELVAVCTTCIVVFGILCLTLMNYKLHQTDAMKSNIESAIVKGIDPLAVKCAYGSDDATCVAYAMRRNDNRVEISSKK